MSEDIIVGKSLIGGEAETLTWYEKRKDRVLTPRRSIPDVMWWSVTAECSSQSPTPSKWKPARGVSARIKALTQEALFLFRGSWLLALGNTGETREEIDGMLTVCGPVMLWRRGIDSPGGNFTLECSHPGMKHSIALCADWLAQGNVIPANAAAEELAFEALEAAGVDLWEHRLVILPLNDEALEEIRKDGRIEVTFK